MPSQTADKGYDSVTSAGKEFEGIQPDLAALDFTQSGPKVPTAADLGVTPVPIARVPDGQPQRFSKTIKFNGQERTFYGNTEAELNNEMAKALENANAYIDQLKQTKQPFQPDKTPVYQRSDIKPRQLTSAESLAIADLQASNPDAAMRKWLELSLGTTLEGLADRLNRTEEITERDKIQAEIAAFTNSHRSDYEDSDANGAAIKNLLTQQGLPMKRANFEYAFETLKAQGHKFVTEAPPPVVPPVRPASPPTFISDRNGQPPETARETRGLDVTKLQGMNLSEMRDAIQTHLRSQSAGARR